VGAGGVPAAQSVVPPPPPAPLPNLGSGGIRSVVLYAYETCPFCNIVRAYLDLRKIPYILVEVDPLFHREIAFSKGYKKVPIAVVNGVQVNDSSRIIDAIEAARGGGVTEASPPPALLPAQQSLDAEEEKKWRTWVYDRLVHVLTPNLYRSFGESWRSFDYLTQRNFASWTILPTKIAGTVAMVAVARMQKKKYGIVDERAELYAALNDFVAAVGPSRPFLGGAQPNLADITTFGVLRAVEGIEAHSDAMQHSNIKEWYGRMKERVGATALECRVGEAPSQPPSQAK
jgi:microsomal prostaglandin-E synthase 2